LSAQFERCARAYALRNVLTPFEADARELGIEFARIADIRVAVAIQKLRRLRKERVDERA
jgi:hypothetical protein